MCNQQDGMIRKKNCNTLSFTLQLPDSMKSIHPVFHVSQLEISTPNTIPNCTLTPPPPIEVDREVEYEIAEILNSKIDQQHRQCKLFYLVSWAGYEGTKEETSRLLAMELGNASELVEVYHSCYLTKPGPHRP